MLSQKKAWFHVWAALLNRAVWFDSLALRSTPSRLTPAQILPGQEAVQVLDVFGVMAPVMNFQCLLTEMRLKVLQAVRQCGKFKSCMDGLVRH
jgi:hypothetical protein